MTIFPQWVPLTDGFGYSGESNSLSYSARYKAPYSTETLMNALNLIDPQQRFYAELTNASTYPYKQQIVQSLIPWLTSQRMSIKPVEGYQPNAVDANGNSLDGQWTSNATASNIIQNAQWCLVDVEYMLKPLNSFGFNCCYVSVNGSGEFVEMGTDRSAYTGQLLTANGADLPGRGGVNVITANTPLPANWTDPNQFVPLVNLAKGQTLIEPKDTVTIEYPWVDASLVNLQRMRALRGRVNLNDVLQWYAGTLLYEGSDVESALSPLGNIGYKITHHFTARDIDWNLIPIMPTNTANTTANTTWNQIAYGWATFKPPMMTANGPPTTVQPGGVYPNLTVNNAYNSWQNRLYQYNPFYTYTGNAVNYWAVSDLFYYGFAQNSVWYNPPVNPLPTPS